MSFVRPLCLEEVHPEFVSSPMLFGQEKNRYQLYVDFYLGCLASGIT